MQLNEAYWEQRYQEGYTGWDIGHVSTPLKAYFDQLKNNQQKILIPGAGNAYEAEYLYSLGFENVFVLDISKTALKNFQQRVPEFPSSHLFHHDFFNFEGQFDLIIEQTFFCALDPALRKAYAKKMHSLLAPKGTLSGLLFDFPLTEEGPPFGGSMKEYLSYFNPLFGVRIFERAYNSIEPRKGKELFFSLLKE